MDTCFGEIERLKKELENSKQLISALEHDELTGLFTRQAFLQRAERRVKENPNMAYGILAVDCENFKSSNSLYGEDRCNEFLSFISHKMLEKIPNTLIGRFGGDQFAILFDASKDYYSIIESNKTNILKDSPIPNQIIKFGIYAPIDRDLLMVRCCDRAFLAMKGIKGVYGRTIAVYEDSIQQQVVNEQKIVDSMESALKNGEFLVFYQPKHESVSENIAGAEALVRWHHPIYGFMAPSQFIPLFERNGFITKLDTYILERVCQDISRWQNDGFPVVPISVNISRRDYLEHGRIEKNLELIDKYKIDHKLIHMEVTESMYSENTDLIVSKVRDTQNSGFLIEMDDFGSGYSSLGLLSSFPLDVIKLDISFVKNIDVNKIVIENIIKMAHKMGLVTIAEGVETDIQFKILKGLGCDLIQGYFFSKPLTVSDFESYLRHHTVSSYTKVHKSQASIVSKDDEEKMLMVANEVAEGIPGGFFSYHADEDLEIISFNQELLSIFDCKTAEEFREYTKNTFKGIVHPDDYETVQKVIDEQITADNKLDYVEYRIISKSGKIKYVQDFGRFVETENFGGIFYVFLYDITEDKLRKEAEAEDRRKKLELEKSAEIAEKANTSKNIFMNNLSEDILPIIKELIKVTKDIENEQNNDSEVIRASVEKAKNIEEHLLGLINNLSELSKLELGNVSLDETPSDLTSAMERTCNMLSETAKKKNITLEYWSDIYNPYIYQDVFHTTDVVFNILQNALKYTPSGGKVRFGIKQLPGRNENECIINFYCEDTGIGISEQFLPRVFDALAREDNPVNNSIPSSGVGLNIAYQLLLLMKGTIHIESQQGKGTSVVTSQPHRLARKEDVEANSTTLLEKLR